MQTRSIVFLSFISLLCANIAEAEMLFPYAGQLNLDKKELQLTINPSDAHPLSLSIIKQEDKSIKIAANIDHLTTSFFVLSTVLDALIEYIPTKDTGEPSLTGKIESKYTLINFKPGDELSGNFELKDRVLIFKSLMMGSHTCKGTVHLAPPFQIDLELKLSDMPLNDFLAFFMDNKIAADGQVSGDIRMTGRWGNIELAGDLTSYNGFVKNLEFDTFNLKAQGIYPKIDIAGTHIAQKDGIIFGLLGVVDLSDKENFSKQIRSLVKEPLVKDEGENLEWTLKRFKMEESSQATELKILRRENLNKSISQDGDSSGMLGVERKMEF